MEKEREDGATKAPVVDENATMPLDGIAQNTAEPIVAPEETVVAEETIPEGYNTIVAGCEEVYPEEYEAECGPLRGWLLLFLIMGVGIGSLVTVYEAFSNYHDGPFFTLSLVNEFYSLAYLALGAFTILAFVKRDSDAVLLAKSFIVINVLSNCTLLLLIGTLGVETVLPDAVKSLLWGGVWFAFMCNSSQVQERIPEETRKAKIRSWILVAVAAVLLITTSAFSVQLAATLD